MTTKGNEEVPVFLEVEDVQICLGFVKTSIYRDEQLLFATLGFEKCFTRIYENHNLTEKILSTKKEILVMLLTSVSNAVRKTLVRDQKFEDEVYSMCHKSVMGRVITDIIGIERKERNSHDI